MDRLSHEVDSPYINAPNWPWTVAGVTLSALHVLLFVVGWLQRAV